MIHFSALLLAFAIAGSVTAAPSPLTKRIAQNISDSTKKWEAACVSLSIEAQRFTVDFNAPFLSCQTAANGGAQCNAIAVKAFGTLLAAAGACEQQDNADIMMDLSKKLNSPDMISAAQIFAQQPRNTVRLKTVFPPSPVTLCSIFFW